MFFLKFVPLQRYQFSTIMNRQLARLMQAMIKYDSGDVPRIQHFVKVHDFAAMIGMMENLDEGT